MGNPPLIVGLLINGVAYAAIFIVAAVLLSRFTSEVVWRSFLVLSLAALICLHRYGSTTSGTPAPRSYSPATSIPSMSRSS
jgi:hypothetical protein